MEYIKIFGIIGIDTTLKSVKEQYNSLKNKDNIRIVIDSVGGDVEDGFEIRKFFIGLGREKLETHIIGACYSIATIISLCANKDKRFITNQGSYMVHLPFIEGLECYGNLCNADYLEWTAKYVKRAEKRVIDVYISEIGNTFDYWKEFMKEEKFLDYGQAKEYNFVTDISELNNLENKHLKNKAIIFMEKPKKTIADEATKKDEPKMTELKNIDLVLQDGTKIYVKSEDGEFVGKEVYNADTQELLADGDYVLSDNRVFSVVSGVITQISEIEVEIDDKEMTDEKIAELVKNLTAAQIEKIVGATTKTPKPPKTQIQKELSVMNAGEKAKHHFLEQVKLRCLANMNARNNDGSFVVRNVNILAPSLSYTYNGIEDMNVLFYKPTIMTPDMLRLFRVLPNVKSKQQLFIVGATGKIIKKDTGNCAVTETGNGTTLSNRVLETTNLRLRTEECADAWNGIIFEEWTKAGFEKGDLTGTEIETIILNVVRDAMRRDWFRIFSFGDTTSTNADYNQLDGMWKRIFVDNTIPVGNNNIQVLNNTAGTTAIDYLQDLYQKAKGVLAQLPKDKKAFYVTRNVYENLEVQYTNRIAELAYTQLQDGTEALTFRGIPVVCMYAWSNDLADVTNPLNATKDILILYTTNENHVIGIDGSGDEQNVNFFFDAYHQKNVVLGRFKLGYNFVHSDLIAVSSGLID